MNGFSDISLNSLFYHCTSTFYSILLCVWNMPYARMVHKLHFVHLIVIQTKLLLLVFVVFYLYFM